MPNSDYIVYADESGDHGLVSIDPEHPVFVLAFCIFQQDEYMHAVAPAVQRFKFKHFGHDLVILHSHDVRKASGDFRILRDARIRAPFLEALTTLVRDVPFTIVAAVIDKAKLTRRYVYPSNPYNIALTFCLERTYAFLKDRNQHQGVTTICFESRGRREDDELELEFRRVAAGANKWGKLPFEIRFAGKAANSSGMQLADLAAHPIGRHVIRPDQENRSFAAIEGKFRRSPSGAVRGWGLKVFP